MSMTIAPGLGNEPSATTKPKKNIFGTAQQRAFKTDDSRVGIYKSSAGDGLETQLARMSKGGWYTGEAETAQLFESYCRQLTGDKVYERGSGAKYGYIGQLARRLPTPILFDDPEIAKFIFGENKPTACVDTSGRMWMFDRFFEECLQEEIREKTMVLPLFIHEYLHVALNHTHRMHNFPPDVSNIAKDKVINPMDKQMFSPSTSFSIIFSEAHGNAAEDQKYAGLSEETIAKMILKERQKALEEKGTIRIKNLIIVDGPVKAITTLKAGRDETKEFDTITVTVQDMGMMDKVDHIFDCATLEIDNIDNRLKTRKRPGMPGQPSDEESGPIEIPVESDQPSASDGNGKSDPNSQQKPDDAASGSDTDGRKDLSDVMKDLAQKQADQAAEKDPSKGQGQGQGSPTSGQDPADSGQGAGQGQAQSGKPGQPGQVGQAGGTPGSDPSQGNGGQSPQQGPSGGQQPQQNPGPGRSDPAAGSKVGNGSGNLKGDPSSILDGLIRGNPLNAPGGHELDVTKLNEWLKATGRSEMVKEMRMDDFSPEQVERAIDVALNEAEKERLIIGSGYAGGHINDYMNTVVRPNSTYKLHWERMVTEFLQGQGTNLVKTMEEYGIYTYIDPVDYGMPVDDGVYVEGSVAQKPDEKFLIIIDTSGSVWADKKRLGHFVALAVGVKATADEMSPDIDIVGADTCVSGKPVMYDDESIMDAVEKGVPLGGGGGTDFVRPINQILAWAKENDIVYQGVVYVTDFECSAPKREDLPDDMPPLMWIGMPHDYAKAQEFIDQVSTYSIVRVIEDELNIDFREAQEKARDTAHLGHSKLSM